MAFEKIIETVPNFSTADGAVVEKIADCFRGRAGVKLLNYSSDKDHGRSVITAAGEIEPLKNAVLEAVGVAADLIDLRTQKGQHPRIGATDVVPFIPIKNVTGDEADKVAVDVGKEIWARYAIPVFLYEKSASAPHRQNLADIRKGQYEGMAEKILSPEWKPDFGDKLNLKAGATAVGHRAPLVAFNVNLDTPDVEIATKIAKKVRHIGGGLRFVKAMGVLLNERKISQVSMNLTDFNKTSLYFALELIKVEARRFGVNIVGSEIIGLVPLKALVDCADYYLQLENFSLEQVLEVKLGE